jgi:hypothetical protein
LPNHRLPKNVYVEKIRPVVMQITMYVTIKLTAALHDFTVMNLSVDIKTKRNAYEVKLHGKKS